MASLINIGLTGLKAHQTALSTTGNNVTNTNTPGYSRQEVVFDTATSQLTGAGYVGSGVNIETVRRINQDFVNNQLRADTTVFNETEAILNQASQVDDLLGSNTTGITSSLNEFFKAVQSGADNPSSVPERQLLLTQAEGLVGRFNSLSGRLTTQVENIEKEMFGHVSEINSLSASLAKLNQAITVAIGAGQGDLPNGLLDERDETLRQLSELVNVSVIDQNDGQVNVFIGKGQPLVIANKATEMAVVPSATDSSLTDIAFIDQGRLQIITSDITGGSLGGILDFRDNTLKETINSLGRVALVMADTFNEQHRLGMDLEGNLGNNFFVDVNDTTLMRSRVIGSSNNNPPADRILGVEITDVTELTIDDYELRFTGPTNSDYVLMRASDNEVIRQGTLPGFFPATIPGVGFQINLETGSFQPGDSYLIQPTRNGARDIELFADRVEELAFASPIRAEASIGNTGNAQISQGTMLDVNNPLTNQVLPTFAVSGQMSPPMAVRFITDTVYEVVDMTDPARPQPLVPPLNNQTYIPGLKNEIFTTDPGATVVSSRGTSLDNIPAAAAPLAGAKPFVNGYGAQNLTIFTRDLTTGVVTPQTVAINANDTARDIGQRLSNIQGISASSYSEAVLSNFVDDGAGASLDLSIHYQQGAVGQTLTIPFPDSQDPDMIVAQINGSLDLQQLGYIAETDGFAVTIRNTQGRDIEISANGSAGDSVSVSKVNPYTGAVVDTEVVSGGNGVAVGGFLDVTLSEGVTMAADVNSVFQQAPPATSAYRGFAVDIIGEAKKGDLFTISYNTNGTSDNRNALALGALETTGFADGGVSTYHEAYAQMVESVGTYTNQTRLDKEASQALLQQSQQKWDEISGVNLDEEAGKLIQYQAAYNASAQVVSIARELFDTLLSTFR